MMDPLSATASIITLLQLTVALAKTSASLYVKLKDAPKDLDGVQDRRIIVNDDNARHGTPPWNRLNQRLHIVKPKSRGCFGT